LGIYSYIIYDDQNIIDEDTAGYLVRTKVICI
jgi:hypothetical protein